MAAAMARVDTEIDNLRAALRLGRPRPTSRRLSRLPSRSARTGGSGTIGTDGLDRLARLIGSIPRLSEPAAGERPARASLVARLYATAALVGGSTNRRLDAVRGWAGDALALARDSGDRAALAVALASRFVALEFAGGSPSDDTLGVAIETVIVAEEVGDWFMVAQSAASIATHIALSDPEGATSWCARATEAGTRAGNPYAIGFAAYAWGYVLGGLGRLDEARPHYLEALARMRELGDRRMQLVVRTDMAHALRHAGRSAEAVAEYRETIVEWHRLGHRGAVAHQLESFGFVAREAGRPDRAVTLLGAASRLREVAAAPMLEPERVEHEAQLAKLRAALGPAEFERAWAEGRGLSTDAAVALAVDGDARPAMETPGVTPA